MCKIIAIANQKGGQSKSTTAVNLAVGLARNGKRVAVVDADPQGSCTASLGYKEPDELEITLATILGHIIDEEEFDPRAGILHHEDLRYQPYGRCHQHRHRLCECRTGYIEQ